MSVFLIKKCVKFSDTRSLAAGVSLMDFLEPHGRVRASDEMLLQGLQSNEGGELFKFAPFAV